MILKTIKENIFVVISKPQCYYCILVKELLRIKNIDYVEIIYNENMTSDIEYLKSKYNIKSYPMIFINKIYIGGYRELINYPL
jgi:glutaredoxin